MPTGSEQMRNKKAKIIWDIYNILHANYGNLNWWPASSPYEVMVGAVLTQNTAWSNVEKRCAD